MSVLAGEYAIPPELETFVDEGFLELLSKKPEQKTLEFQGSSQNPFKILR